MSVNREPMVKLVQVVLMDAGEHLAQEVFQALMVQPVQRVHVVQPESEAPDYLVCLVNKVCLVLMARQVQTEPQAEMAQVQPVNKVHRVYRALKVSPVYPEVRGDRVHQVHPDRRAKVSMSQTTFRLTLDSVKLVLRAPKRAAHQALQVLPACQARRDMADTLANQEQSVRLASLVQLVRPAHLERRV